MKGIKNQGWKVMTKHPIVSAPIHTKKHNRITVAAVSTPARPRRSTPLTFKKNRAANKRNSQRRQIITPREKRALNDLRRSIMVRASGLIMLRPRINMVKTAPSMEIVNAEKKAI